MWKDGGGSGSLQLLNQTLASRLDLEPGFGGEISADQRDLHYGKRRRTIFQLQWLGSELHAKQNQRRPSPIFMRRYLGLWYYLTACTSRAVTVFVLNNAGPFLIHTHHCNTTAPLLLASNGY